MEVDKDPKDTKGDGKDKKTEEKPKPTGPMATIEGKSQRRDYFFIFKTHKIYRNECV